MITEGDGKNVEEQQPGDIQGTQIDLHTQSDALTTKLEDKGVSQDTAANLDASNQLLQMFNNKSKSVSLFNSHLLLIIFVAM